MSHSETTPHAAHSLSPSPTITRHRAGIAPAVRANDILGSITGGAHYSGALPQRNADEPPLHPKAWRRRSLRSTELDPSVALAFKDVVSDLEQLYGGKPSLEIVRRRWHKDALLEHPLFKCKNLREISAVLFALPRLLRTVQHVQTRILSAGLSPNRLVYTQTYVYTLRLFGIRKEIKSVVFVDLDEDMKIVQLMDEWNGEEPSSRWGAASLRRLFAKIISWTTRVPKHTG
ncbi:hypothetical protein TRAPUB_9242 [Trametes pubescens]|uniref:Uncharacterized protein n=1 Tax=Trametes pubescens TaxID=154538 RepID=A0A1M2W2Q6_TRAPU|nr:hypothetical protein TRAPUB_9242 [Trametes pubescens]